MKKDIFSCFNLAVHEIRHRVQIFKKLKGEKFEIFTKEDFEKFMEENFSEFIKEKGYEIFKKYLESKEKTSDINEEIDAILIGTACEILFRKEKISMNDILKLINSDKKEEILEIIKKNPEWINEVFIPKLKNKFFE
jgi:predicted site-specific integrase-resolvase